MHLPNHVGLIATTEPVNQSYALTKRRYGTHSGEAVKTQKITLDITGLLITSKTRLKLLLRFFLNRNLCWYLHELSKEVDDNTNGTWVEPNRLEEAGLLMSELDGRRKAFCVNFPYPLTSDITSIVHKVSGIETLIERVVENFLGLNQVWVRGDLARGAESKTIDTLLTGEQLDPSYIGGLSNKVEKLTDKKVYAQIFDYMFGDIAAICLFM